MRLKPTSGQLYYPNDKPILYILWLDLGWCFCEIPMKTATTLSDSIYGLYICNFQHQASGMAH